MTNQLTQLSLAFLGQFRVTLADQPVIAFASDKARALLAYLAMERARPHSRSALAALLWPEYSEESARTNLRQALHQLRDAIGDTSDVTAPFLLITRQTIQFNAAAPFSLDVATFQSLLHECASHNHNVDRPGRIGHGGIGQCVACRQRLRQAADLYQSDFLQGFAVADSAPFEEWRRITQEHLHLQMVDALCLLANSYEATGDDEQTRHFAARQLALEPWREETHQQIMRALARSGQRTAALIQYNLCRQVLATELGVEPNTATKQLYAQIQSGAFPPHLPVRQESNLPSGATHPLPALSNSSPNLRATLTSDTFAARSRELATLDRWLDAALAGQGRVALITGEAGSGKTTLLREFVQRAQTKHQALVVAIGVCDAQTGSGDPYLPFRELLSQLTGAIDASWTGGLLPAESVQRLENQMVSAVATLMATAPDLVDSLVPGASLHTRMATVAPADAAWLHQLAQLVAQRQANPAGAAITQAQLFTQTVSLLQTLAARQPLVLLLDDLHWADASSLNVFAYLARRIDRSRILLIGAYRPEEISQAEDEQPQKLTAISHELKRHFGNIHLNLEQVSATERRQFVDEWLDTQPNRLGEAFRQALFQQTEGHALFTTELVQDMQERGDLRRDSSGRWVERADLDWNALPARIEGVIATRLDRLPANLRRALVIASIEGEEFTAEVIGKVLGLDETTLLKTLSYDLDRRHRLVSAQRLLWIGEQCLSLYRFRHNLFQKYLYQSLDAVERARLHAQVGSMLETLYATEQTTYAVQLARHFAAAGMLEKAVDYLHQAGEHAHHLLANVEAIEHLRHGLALLVTLPNTARRAERELALQILLGNALIAVQGYAAAAVGAAFHRARALCQQLGDTPQLFLVLHGLHRHCYNAGDWELARELGEQMVHLAEHNVDPRLRPEAHRALGLTQWLQGEFDAAYAHFTQGIAAYDPQHHTTYLRQTGQDPGVVCLGASALALCCLGYVDQARQGLNQALSLAQTIAHPFVLTYTHFYASLFHQFACEPTAVRQHAETIIALARQHEFTYYLGVGTVLRGWAQNQLGDRIAGMAEMQEGMTIIQETGTVLFRHYYLSFLADAYRQVGDGQAGLKIVSEALAVVPSSGRFWEAELYRLQGELLLLDQAAGAETAAEMSFQQAVTIAQGQRAKVLELRATVSLSRLWQNQGRRAEAQTMLASIYNWFREGFDTADLQAAQSLLAIWLSNQSALPVLPSR